MPRKPPAIEPPDASTNPNDPDEETTPIEGSEPTASADASTSSASEENSASEDSSVSGENSASEERTESGASTEIPEPAASTSSASGENSASTGSAPGGQTPLAGNRFFSWIRGIDIRREPGWIGGVCAGIAARLGIDPLIVRGIAVVIAVLGGPAILLYAVAWLLLPDANDKIHLEEVFRGRLESPIAAIGALIVLSLLPVTQGFWLVGAGFWGVPDWGGSVWRVLGTLGLLTLLVWFIVWLARRGTTPVAPAATRPRDASAFVAGETGTSAPFAAPATAAFTSAPASATEPELAAWREQQAQVRAEQDAFRNQQASDKAAANRAAAEEARLKRAAQREVDRAENARTRSHPLFSLIVIGLSIVAGGLATVTIANGEITVTAAVVGLAVMLAVLAIGIIINGVRGKRSGGSAGVAAIVLPVLLITAAASTGESTFVRWGPTTVLTPTSAQDFAIAGGRVELDLTEMKLNNDQGYDEGYESSEVRLNLGAGDATIVLPEGVHTVVSATVGAGSIDAEGDTSRTGPVETLYAEHNSVEGYGALLYVTVQMGAGHITVVEEGENR